MNLDNNRYFYGGIVFGAAVASILYLFFREVINSRKDMPNTEKVQEGYIAPGRLEIILEDLDMNGEKETILQIDKIPYLLQEVEGKPILSRYEIRPAEIIPQNHH